MNEIVRTEAEIRVNFEVKDLHFSRKNLKSIVYNLLSNAIKYKQLDKTPFITLSTQEAGEYVMLSVSDNGLGMDLGKSQKLFTMFHRLHNHVEGTGIGLYIVKRIVDNAGGKIEVESRLEKGTTFRVYFKK